MDDKLRIRCFPGLLVTLVSCRVVFAVRYAEPETLAPRESGNVNIEGGYPPSSNSKIARLESEVKMLQEKLVSKL